MSLNCGRETNVTWFDDLQLPVEEVGAGLLRGDKGDPAGKDQEPVVRVEVVTSSAVLPKTAEYLKPPFVLLR